MLLILKSKKKNGSKMRKFLQLISKSLDQKKITHSFSSFEDVELFLERKKIKILIDGNLITKWNTIYPRKVGKNKGLAHILARLSKKMGVYFIDRYHEQTKDTSDAAKIIQMFQLAVAGVSIPKTYYAGSYSKKHLQNAVAYLKLPIVIKECNTSRGEGVFLAENINELEKIISERFKKDEKKEIFLQEFVPNDFEYRIFVAGDRIAVIEKKIRSNKEKFRNNVHLGAREEFVDISKVGKDIKKEALLASKITNIDVAGVDIVEGKKGQPIIFEVNACPAFTLNEKVSNEIDRLADYLSKCEKKRNS